MSDIRGLVVDDKMKQLGPILFMIWIQFNQANELINCVGVVDTRRLDIRKEAWPGLSQSGDVSIDAKRLEKPQY